MNKQLLLIFSAGALLSAVLAIKHYPHSNRSIASIQTVPWDQPAAESLHTGEHRQQTEGLRRSADSESEADAEQGEGSLDRDGYLFWGRVIDSQGARIPFALISKVDGDESTPPIHCDKNGEFRLPLPELDYGALYWCVTPGLSTISSARVSLVGERQGTTIICAPSKTLSGRVTCRGSGVGLAGVTISAETSLEFKAGISSLASTHKTDSAPPIWTTISDSDGGFVIDALPRDADFVLTSRYPEYETLRLAIEDSQETVQCVLSRRTDEETVLRGLVVDRHGTPIPGAAVCWGGLSTKTADDGRFSLDLRGAARDKAVLAIGKRPYVSLVERDFDAFRAAKEVDQERREYQLLDDAAPISVRIVNDAQQPLQGWRVDIVELTPLYAGHPVPAELVGNPGNKGWAMPDVEGMAEIGDLDSQRSYTLRLTNVRSLVQKLVSGVAPGAVHSIAISKKEASIGDVVLRGRAVCVNGHALRAAQVFAAQRVGFGANPSSSIATSVVSTDEDGFFEIGGLGCVPDEVLLASAGYSKQGFEYVDREETDREVAWVHLHGSVRVPVEVQAPVDPAGRFVLQIFNGAGRMLKFAVSSAGRSTRVSSISLRGGSRVRLLVPEEAEIFTLHSEEAGGETLSRQVSLCHEGDAVPVEF